MAGDFAMPQNSLEELTELIGEEKAKRNIPVKDVAGTGAKVTLSSDFDVSPVNPFLGKFLLKYMCL